MNCPTCELHAKLHTSSEYDAKNDDGLSGDAAISSVDDMIELCRETVKGSSNASGAAENHDGARVLHAVRRGQLVYGQSRPVAPDDIRSMYSARIAMGLLTTRLSLLAMCSDGTDSMRELLEESALYAETLNAHFGMSSIKWSAAMQNCIREHTPAPVAPVKFQQAAE